MFHIVQLCLVFGVFSRLFLCVQKCYLCRMYALQHFIFLFGVVFGAVFGADCEVFFNVAVHFYKIFSYLGKLLMDCQIYICYTF